MGLQVPLAAVEMLCSDDYLNTVSALGL